MDNFDSGSLQKIVYFISLLIFAVGVIYITSRFIAKKRETPTFENLSLLHMGIFLITIILIAFGFSNKHYMSVFYGLVFGIATLLCGVINVMPAYEYIQMTIGAILIVLLFSIFKKDDESINNSFLLAGLFILWYGATYVTIISKYTAVSQYDGEKMYNSILL